jgi:flagellar motor switch protein FliN
MNPSAPVADAVTDSPAQATAAAEACAAQLPTTAPVSTGAPVPPAELAGQGWTHAAVAPVNRYPGVEVGVLVGGELVEALASAPAGGLDLGAAVQPALDAAAAVFGATAGTARTVSGDHVAGLVGRASWAVPLLHGADPTAVFLLLGPTQALATAAAGSAHATTPPLRGVEMLAGVSMEVTVEIGRTRMSVRDLLALTPGDVLELDRAAGSPADLLVNGRLIARGEVVVVDEDFALRVTEIVAPSGVA